MGGRRQVYPQLPIIVPLVLSGQPRILSPTQLLVVADLAEHGGPIDRVADRLGLGRQWVKITLSSASQLLGREPYGEGAMSTNLIVWYWYHFGRKEMRCAS